MRGVVTALAATVLLGVAGSALAGGEAKRPALRIVDLAPLTVKGANFRAGERVKLLVSAGRPLTAAATAGPRGGFVRRLGVSVAGCTAVVVQAIGNRGSRAMVDVTRPGCGERPDER